MMQYSRAILLIAFTIGSYLAFSQSGNYLLSQHQPSFKDADNTNFQILEHSSGILFLANRNGIVKYDGITWEHIETPGAIFNLVIDEEGTIFAGGSNGFGFLQTNGIGEKYISLSDSLSIANDIFKIAISGDNVYFLNQKNVFIYNKVTQKISSLPYDDPSTLTCILQYGESIYVSSEDGKFFEIENNSLHQLNRPSLDSTAIIFSRQIEDGNLLVGTLGDNLFIFNGDSFFRIKLAEHSLLASDQVIDAIIIDELISVATLGGGVYFFRLSDGSLVKTVDYLAGLPDNEVFALGMERSGGIWVAHTYGLTLINPQLPFRNMASFPGLEGNITAIKSASGKLYVGTTTGLFLLDEEIKYKEVAYYVTVNEDSKGETISKTNPTKTGVFGFLKRNKTLDKEPKSTKGNTRRVRRTRSELVSKRFIYRKVEGINSKVIDINTLDEKVIVGSVNGTYEALNATANLINPEPVRDLFTSKRHGLLFISTLTDELILYSNSGNEWVERFYSGMVDDLIQDIYEDSKGQLWFASSDAIYKVILEPGGVKNTDFFDYENPFFHHMNITEYEDEIILISEDGYLKINHNKLNFEPDTTLNKDFGKPTNIISSSEGITWVYNNVEWLGISGAVTKDNSLNTLSFFKTPTFIELLQDKILVASLDNRIYEFERNAAIEVFSDYNLILKSVSNQNGKITTVNDLEVEHAESKLRFEFIKPDYNRILGIQYQYKLSGLGEQWSIWASNNIVDFPYLPAGKYELLVKSRDIFGNSATLNPIKFRVIAPYWERPWFYALEVFFFGTLFILSFKLKRQDKKYRLLSRMLAFLTLIISVEFVQTIAEYNIAMEGSPVTSFFIQVGIALVILPMEALLRNIFFKENAPPRALKEV